MPDLKLIPRRPRDAEPPAPDSGPHSFRSLAIGSLFLLDGVVWIKTPFRVYRVNDRSVMPTNARAATKRGRHCFVAPETLVEIAPGGAE